MRKNIFATILVATCFLFAPSVVSAESMVEINEANFPDSIFREYVKTLDTSDDGKLSDAEIAAVKEIDVSDKSIKSLEGIEVFTSLEKLDCSRCEVTSLDVSGMSNLKELNCSVNYDHALYDEEGILEYTLSGLYLTGCSKLEVLYCSSGKLSSLLFDSYTNIKNLNCSNNQLTSLSINYSVNLIELDCSVNKLTELDVKGCTNLKTLSCQQMDTLTSLDITGCSALGALHCRKTKIDSLDVSGCSELYALNCSDTLIGSLDVSSNPKLISLTCQGTPLTSLTLNETLMKTVALESKQYDPVADRDVYNTDEPYAFLSIPAGLDIEYTVDINDTNFPDAVFRDYVNSFDTSSDGKLSKEEIADVTEIIVSNKDIKSLEGIRIFKYLEELYCDRNSLTSLDVSGLKKLNVLRGYENENLSSLNIEGCDALGALDCMNTAITELDVKKFPELYSLRCNNTKITYLDLSGNPKMAVLFIDGSTIKTVELNDNLTQAVVSGEYTYNAAENTDKYVLNPGPDQFMLVATHGFEFLYNVSVSEDITGGTVTVDKTENVKAGDVVSVTAAADNGYILKEIVAFDKNGRVYSSLDTEAGAFTMPYCNVSVSATFYLKEYTVTIPENQVGYRLETDVTKIEHGGEVYISVAIKDGYEKTDDFAVKINGEEIELTEYNNVVVTATEDMVITVEGVEPIEQSSAGGTSDKTAEPSDSGKETETGDGFNAVLWAMIMILSLAGGTFVILQRRKDTAE